MSTPLKTLAVIQGTAVMMTEDGSYVRFLADADIDADGANGQNGQIAAYVTFNRGSEALANGGLKMVGDHVEFAASWGKDIVFEGRDGGPAVEHGTGIIPSKTAYKFPGLEDVPAGQVDSETIPYIVVPPVIIGGVRQAVLGCRARVTWRGKSVDAIVADVGPRSKVGELSIAAARALSMNASPRTGGVERFEVSYELWPGDPGVVNGQVIRLQRSNGTHV